MKLIKTTDFEKDVIAETLAMRSVHDGSGYYVLTGAVVGE